jgi:glycolate oxidase FAD binding subunit
VGALGKLGVLVELTFKVFPKPEQYATLCVQKSSLEEAIKTLYTLSTAPLDIEALDFAPSGDGISLWVRVGGLANGLAERMERMQRMIGAGEVMRDAEDAAWWRSVRNFDWAANGIVTKMPMTPERIKEFEMHLAESNPARQYSVGGNVAYVAAVLKHHSLDGIGLLGDAQPSQPKTQHAFAQRIKQALDPHDKFR